MSICGWEVDQKNGLNQQSSCWSPLIRRFKSRRLRKNHSNSIASIHPTLKKSDTDNDSDFHLSELANQSEILTGQDTYSLGPHLPSRAVGFPWKLVYSTTASGFSLSSLYRMSKDIDLPVLLVIKDMKERVFGAFLTCGLRVAENYYGNHDTFLFRFHPRFQTYKWSGNNFYFIQGKEDFISVGHENGKFGLWIDDGLDKGRSEQCATFLSPALVEEKDFKIHTLECWTVIHV